MKVIRILEYDGPEDWVKATLKKSYLKPGSPVHFGSRKTIKCTELPQNQTALVVVEEEKK